LVAAVVAVVLGARRRRRVPVAPASAPPAPHVVSGFYYTDFGDPKGARRVSARPRVITPSVRHNGTGAAPAPSEDAPKPSAAPESVEAPDPPATNGAAVATDQPPAPTEQPAPVDDRRVRVLQLAQELGNISEACRIVGVSRRSYYEWKRVADAEGVDALKSGRRRRPS
jgi:Helix-turn-helix domain